MTDAHREPREPFWAKCCECSHIWACAYLPMNLTEVAKLVKTLHCPMCAAGSDKITPAKQTNGVLQEPAA